MLIVSLFLHLGLFSAVFFVPEPTPARRMTGTIYEVTLVELPRRSPSKAAKASVAKKFPKKGVASRLAPPAERITPVQKKKRKPVVIAKRTLKRKTKKVEKPKTSPTKLIDEAISRIQRKVTAQEKSKTQKKEDAVEAAVAKLSAKLKGRGSEEVGEGPPVSGVISDMYRLEVEDWIKNHWAFPVGLLSPSEVKTLETVLVLKVKQDGTIVDTKVKKQSSNALFNESVLKAVERSNPLPPFPEGYLKSFEEFEISFHPSDLEGD